MIHDPKEQPTRATLALLGSGLALALAASPALGQVPHPTAKCVSGKFKCAGNKAAALFTCYSKEAGAPNATALAACITKAVTKFDGGVNPTKGCFEKLEAKPPCLTADDTGPVESRVDFLVNDIVTDLNPSFPSSPLNACLAGKHKCVSKKIKSLLGCFSKNETKPSASALTTCLQKAEDKFDGGADPAKGCFEKLEPGSCLTVDDTAAIEVKLDAFAESLVPLLSCGNGRTDPGEDCDDGNTTCGDGCSDLCATEVCGDGTQNCNESCDDGNTSNDDACPSDCTIDPCTPNSGSHDTATVSFGTSGGATVASISVLVDYPEGKVSIPGSANQPSVLARISGLPASTTSSTNDLDHALREVVTKSTPFTTIPVGQLFIVDFETCSGAPAAVAGDYSCTVLGASNQFGTDVTANVTCAVTP
jgi:cysteine-rich repeat protein